MINLPPEKQKEWLEQTKKYSGMYIKKRRKSAYPLEYQKLRKKMVKNNVCSDCGKSKHLTVHHKDKNKLNNQLSNLVVLCWYCHSKFHPQMKNKPPFFNKNLI